MIGALSHSAMVALALVLDALIGDPPQIWRRIPHPAALAGHAIGYLDNRLNIQNLPAGSRRLRGIAAITLLVVAALIIGWLIETILGALPFGSLLIAFLAAILIAQRSLFEHVAAVARGLKSDGLAGGRAAVAHIVGRDPSQLDEAGISRAAIESTAENFSDGVVAPAFWFVLLGMPGLLAYKIVNTADSMVGYRTQRHEAFGWASARLDDVLNWIPARLSGALIALAAPACGGRIKIALATMVQDAGIHRSPNAGWPEAAMAGALGIALAGPRTYPDRVVDDPFLNAGGRLDATADDIRRSLRVFVIACILHAVLYGALALVF